MSEIENSLNPNKYSISAFFPCYNEQDNVEKVALQCLEVLKSVTDDFEILIVNDGSQDDTATVAARISETHPQIKLINHEINIGYGGALQSGFKACTKQLIFYTDGDGQFDIRELPGLIKYIPEYDIVSCYRIKRQDSFMRKLNAFCWKKLVDLLLHLNLRDIDCAFKLYKREVFDGMEMHSKGALIDTEILARAKRRGFTIKQIGVSHLPRLAGEQTGAKISVIFRAFKELFLLYKKIVKDAPK